jgi:hypothetical protein
MNESSGMLIVSSPLLKAFSAARVSDSSSWLADAAARLASLLASSFTPRPRVLKLITTAQQQRHGRNSRGGDSMQ